MELPSDTSHSLERCLHSLVMFNRTEGHSEHSTSANDVQL